MEAGQYHEELLTSIAAYEVVGAHAFEHALGSVAEDGVAGEVTVRVVDSLEVVDVGQDDCEVSVFALGAVEFALEDVEDGGAVPDAGEGVAGGLAAELFACGEQLGFFRFKFTSSLSDKPAEDLLATGESPFAPVPDEN